MVCPLATTIVISKTAEVTLHYVQTQAESCEWPLLNNKSFPPRDPL